MSPRRRTRRGTARANPYANRGQSWEAVVATLVYGLSADGKGLGFRQHPQVVPVTTPAGRSKEFRAKWGAKGPPDWLVCLRPDPDEAPWWLLFEAKDCHQERWPLSQIEAHQADWLTRHDALGPRQLAGVLLRHQPPSGARGRWPMSYFLPWSALEPLYTPWRTHHTHQQRLPKDERRRYPGSASLSAEQLRELALSQGPAGTELLTPALESAQFQGWRGTPHQPPPDTAPPTAAPTTAAPGTGGGDAPA